MAKIRPASPSSDSELSRSNTPTYVPKTTPNKINKTKTLKPARKRNPRPPRKSRTKKTAWHNWTEHELSTLACLKLHTCLSYQRISEIFAEKLNLMISGDIIRYKCNVIKGTLAPSQQKRRISGLGGREIWLKFTRLPRISPEVQTILSACGVPAAGLLQATAVPIPAAPGPASAPVTRSTVTRSTTRVIAGLKTVSRERESSSDTISAPASPAYASSSSDTEMPRDITPAPGPRANCSQGLFLPPTPGHNVSSPAPEFPDFIPYDWQYLEIECLCVLSIYVRLSSGEIATTLQQEIGSQANEEDVEMKIDELSGEQDGDWEVWGAKGLSDPDVIMILGKLGF